MQKQNHRSAKDLFGIYIKIKDQLPGIQIRGQKVGLDDPEDGQFQGGYHRKNNQDSHGSDYGAKGITGQTREKQSQPETKS